MSFKLGMAVFAAGLLASGTALADDAGFFAGLDGSGGRAWGSSSTTDGGASFAGGGVVDNVEFGRTTGIGGHIGYKFSTPLSASISYQHIQGDVGWDAHFPLFGIASGFSGKTVSHTVMANLAYDFDLSAATAFRAAAGLGLSFNELSGVVETDKGTGLFLADVADRTRMSPAAQIGAGIQHKLTPDVTVGLDTSIAYSGGFETGSTRSGNLGVTSITPYKIDDVWRANIGASIRLRF